MSNSHSYLLHVLTGEIISIREHGKGEVEFPERCGLPRETATGLSPVRDRIEILEAVLSKGWIRLRHREREVSVEFITEWEATLETLAISVDEIGLGDHCWINLFQLATGECLGVYVHELKRHFTEGMNDDLLERIEMRLQDRRIDQ